jgi:MerR family transcriptional regulator, light-induced transcriptional regulator
MMLPISTVERETGLSKDTLRVWERRYGFPAPQRDAFGERAYPLEQVDKLRSIKRLLDMGHRPGRIVALSDAQLQAMGQVLPSASSVQDAKQAAALQAHMAYIAAHDAQGLHSSLTNALARMGAAAWVCDVVAPLNTLVGQAWACGQLMVHEEHLYTECLQEMLRHTIGSARAHQTLAPPRVLLTTGPTEPHGLGLLMAQVMLVLEGCDCTSLGTQTPLRDMVQAVAAQHADVLALSITASQNSNDVAQGLQDLRRMLPREVAIWVGGSHAMLVRKPLDGITVLTDLRTIGAQVAHWRAQAAQ